MAHTPGPWQFYELPGNDGLGYIRPTPEDGHEIAHHGDTDRSREENVANGHLIKAALDMLIALKSARYDLANIIALVEGEAPGLVDDDHNFIHAMATLTEIDAAIAKAERAP